MMSDLKEQAANLRDAKGLGCGETHKGVRKEGRGKRDAGRGGGREKGTPRGLLGEAQPWGPYNRLWSSGGRGFREAGGGQGHVRGFKKQ